MVKVEYEIFNKIKGGVLLERTAYDKDPDDSDDKNSWMVMKETHPYHGKRDQKEIKKCFDIMAEDIEKHCNGKTPSIFIKVEYGE